MRIRNLLFFPAIFVVMALGACKSSLKLYVFDCGNVHVKDISIFSPGVDKGVAKDLVASCYLIQHEKKGSLMWDAGLADAIADKPDGEPAFGGAINLTVKKKLSAQLKEIGVEPSKVDFIAFSHFHFDHTGNAEYFSKARLLAQNEDYDAAFGKEAGKFGFNPATYGKLKSNPVTKLSADHDVFGDGSVIIKRAVGHTPGHQVLFVDLPKTGPLVLSGDLYHFTKNRTHRRVPSFNFDKKLSLKSIDEIETFVKEKKAKFWIQHDKEQNATIKHSPSFYE